MRAPAFSALCADVKADATCRLLDGGTLRLYDGEKPGSADAPARRAPLATLRFGPAAFASSRGGRAAARAFEPCLGDIQGTPTWFRALAADGLAVLDGTVGPSGSGEEYDMYVDGDVFEGGEVVVESLVYEERVNRQDNRGGTT